MVVVTARSGRLETRKVTSTPLLTVFSRPVFPEPRVLGINFVNRTGTGRLKYRLNLIVLRKIKLTSVIYFLTYRFNKAGAEVFTERIGRCHIFSFVMTILATRTWKFVRSRSGSLFGFKISFQKILIKYVIYCEN